MYVCTSSGLWTPCAPRGVVSFSRGDRVVAALQALDVIEKTQKRLHVHAAQNSPVLVFITS
jgi:hypothetical protein